MLWQHQLKGDPLAWLLALDSPGVRYLAMRDLLDVPSDDPGLRAAAQTAHTQGLIATILAHMDPAGYWAAPGPGYNPKYRSTVWSVITLAQLGAAYAADERIAQACDYLVTHALMPGGQFIASGAPSGTADCLQGNLCWALVTLGYDLDRLAPAMAWMARSVTGVAKYARYFKEGYDAYGVPDRELSAQRAAWLNAYRNELGLEGCLDLGDLLWQSGKYEEGFLAIAFAGAFKHEFRPHTLDRLDRWFVIGIGNWAHTDVLCGMLAEFLTQEIVPLEAFGPWREAPSKYQRRAVPVTLLPLLKIRQEYTPLLDFLRPLMLDTERVVQQGLGWFLREAWKRRPEAVESFLLEWKDSAPRLIFQYATEKMTPANRARFRKAK